MLRNTNNGSPNRKHNNATGTRLGQTNNNAVTGSGSKTSSKKATLESNIRYWCWMICGVVFSFLSIDYSMRTLFPDTTENAGDGAAENGATDRLPGSTGLLSMASSRTALMDGLLDDATIISTLPTQPMNDLHNNNNNHIDNNYAFDNTAQIEPDPNQHAILIPYRDRPFHLELFLEYMGPYLHTHFPHATFTLWIIEQDDIELFNRAWLANVGLREIVKTQPTTSCVIFHDVDLVPNMTSHVPYTTCQWPMQLGSRVQHFNWSVPYPAYAGGITTTNWNHYVGMWDGSTISLYINGVLEDTDSYK